MLMNRRHLRNRCPVAGFTLIEIMVVIVILGLLAAVVVPKIVGRTDDARRTTAKMEIRNVESALHLFKLDTGFYPSTDQSLDALVVKPTIGRIPNNWRDGGYLPSRTRSRIEARTFLNSPSSP